MASWRSRSWSASIKADAPSDHRYDLLGRDDIWLDWLGRSDPDHEGHRALDRARPGDAFTLEARGPATAIVDAAGREVARLSKEGRERWGPRSGHGLRLKLVAVVRERATDSWRTEEYRRLLRVAAWWTGLWEARWRQ